MERSNNTSNNSFEEIEANTNEESEEEHMELEEEIEEEDAQAESSNNELSNSCTSHVIEVEEEHCSSNDSNTSNACNCNCHEAAKTNLGFQTDEHVINIQVQNINDVQGPSSINNIQYVREISNISSISASVKPPAYNSLGEYFLKDEPPKYQDITGKKLATELQVSSPVTLTPTSTQATNAMNYKSKIAGSFILFGVILITALLVYLSITSDSPSDKRN